MRVAPEVLAVDQRLPLVVAVPPHPHVVLVDAGVVDLVHEQGDELLVAVGVLGEVGEDRALLDLVDERLHAHVRLPCLAHVLAVLFVHRWRGESVDLEEVVKGVEELHSWVAHEDIVLEVGRDVVIQSAQEAGDEAAVHVRVLTVILI